MSHQVYSGQLPGVKYHGLTGLKGLEPEDSVRAKFKKRHICLGQDVYVLDRTYMSWLGHICFGQDIYVLVRTYMSWPGHICLGLARTHISQCCFQLLAPTL